LALLIALCLFTVFYKFYSRGVRSNKNNYIFNKNDTMKPKISIDIDIALPRDSPALGLTPGVISDMGVA